MTERRARLSTHHVRRPLCAALAGALALGQLAGCSQIAQTQARAQQVQDTAVQLRDRAVANATSATVTRTAHPRISGEEVTLRAQNALPELFNRRVSYATQGAQSLAEVLDSVAAMAGIAVRATEIAQHTQDAAAAGAANSAAATPSGGLQGRVQIEFNGQLRGLLDELASRSDASWRYLPKSHSVEFFRYETRTLSVNLPAGAKSMAAAITLAGVSGGGSGAATAGGSTASNAGNVSVSQNLSVDPWASIMASIQSILGEDRVRGNTAGGAAANAGATSGAAANANTAGNPSAAVSSVSGPAGRASANPAFGIITVTARPAAVEQIASYVTSINARFAQNVMIDVKIYNLTLDNQASLGFSLDLLYQRLNSYGVSVVGGTPLQPGTGTPGQITLSSTNPAGRWNGSQVVAQALSQFGNVALQTQGQVLAINGQPSPIQVANEVNYLASSATTTAANVGTTSTLTPGTRVVGFTANFLPLILGDNRILLQYQMQISALTALTQVNSGTSSIQTPQISSQSLQQQAFVRDGQAIVLFGFDQNRDTANRAAGLGGASAAARTERQMVVIVLQVNAGARDA